MFDHRIVSRALREVAKQVSKAQDPSKLRDLVVELNALLDKIEVQAARLEKQKSSLPH